MKFINLILGISWFFFFAYDMEHTRSMFTWGWLLLSILNLGSYFCDYVIEQIKKKE